MSTLNAYRHYMKHKEKGPTSAQRELLKAVYNGATLALVKKYTKRGTPIWQAVLNQVNSDPKTINQNVVFACVRYGWLSFPLLGDRKEVTLTDEGARWVAK